MLKQETSFDSPASIIVSGDTAFVMEAFPFKIKINDPAISNLRFVKLGGGNVYLTAWQQLFNPAPRIIDDKFQVTTSFTQNGQTVSSIRSGQKVKMLVEVNVLKDADYSMLKVPIPAGCVFVEKATSRL